MPLVLAAGETPAFLTQTAALVIGAAVVAYLGARIGLVPIVGFLLAGILIGPDQLGLVSDMATVEQVAEIGVILLLFTIGLEFSIARLVSIWRLIAIGGGLQVVLSVALTTGLLVAFGVDTGAAVFTGFLVSLSSTAIVLKLLADRREMSTAHGQASVGLLLFQDLAIVFMVLFVPLLGGEGGRPLDIVTALGTAVGVIVAVLVVARRLMPPILESIARACSPEVFLLSIVAICMGTAYLTSLAGVSVSLGAFLAGLVVSESRVSEYALSEILSIQVIFSAVFFVSVGMLLDVGFVVENLPLILGVVAVVLLIKLVTTAGAVRALGQPLPTVAASALLLAQVGEFSFVLEGVGREAGLSPADMGTEGGQLFIAASVLLLIATPLLAGAGTTLRTRLEAKAPDEVREARATMAATTEPVQIHDHAVLAGYGRATRALVPQLDAARIPYVIITLSPEAATEATAEGRVVVLGNPAHRHALELARVQQAKIVVVIDDDPEMAARVAGVASALAPHTPVLARTRDDGALDKLVESGATDAVSDDRLVAAGLLRHLLMAFDAGPDVFAPLAADLESRPIGLVGAGARTAARTATVEAIDSDTAYVFSPAAAGLCEHLDQIRPVLPSAEGCEECLEEGQRWVHLRICLSCGHVGCCDSSPGRHATAHFRAADHPVVASLEVGESWGWCYADRVDVDRVEGAQGAEAI